MLLGDIIKQYREEHQMSLQDFANLVHTSRSYIHMLEKNYNPATGKPISPSVETLKSISNAMNINLEDLLKQLDNDQDIYLDEEEYQKQFKDEELNSMMEKCSERLKSCRVNNNFSIEYISEKINVPINKIQRWEDGITSDISNKTLSILADLYNVSPVWLMGYDVPIEREIKTESNVFPIADTPKKVPVVGKISAGLPILAVENIEGYEFAPSSYIKEGYEYFYLRVSGDSMNLKFNDGDIVLVQKQDTLENDEIGVILVDGNDATVKKYKSDNGLIILEPMSTNPENTVQIYNPKHIEVRIIGKVVSYQGKV